MSPETGWRSDSSPAAGTAARILSRYLAGEFLRIFALCLAAFVAIYLIVDFFDRFDDFVEHRATAGAMVRYFLFKIPLVVTQVTPVAVLASTLLALGTLSRHNEITAMHACGVSVFQIALPLAAVSAALSLGSLAWNEAVVPHFNRKARYINTVEIKKRELPSLLGTTELWAHGEDAFYNVRALDTRNRLLVGVTLYRLDGEFNLREIVEVPVARWQESRWVFDRGTRRLLGETGEIESSPLGPGALDLRETPGELMAARHEAEEFNFFALRQLIENLSRKGLDPTEYQVDLHLKLSVPFISLVMALLAIPIGIRNLRTSGLAANVGTGLAIGFSYWVVLGLAVPLGHSGALPPVVAAWAANAIFAGIGFFLLLGGT